MHEIGEYTYGHPRIIDYDHGPRLKIGKFCSISDGATIMLGGEHRMDLVSTYPFYANFRPDLYDKEKVHKLKGDVIIGNDVWIGHEALILSGVHIHNGAVIGARALVTRDVTSYSVVGGVPARHLKYRVPVEMIGPLNEIAWWDWPLEKIVEAIPMLLSDDVRVFVEKYHGKN